MSGHEHLKENFKKFLEGKKEYPPKQVMYKLVALTAFTTLAIVVFLYSATFLFFIKTAHCPLG